MLDSRRRIKIKNSKVQQWRIELASFSYTIKYRPGKQNTGPDTFSRAFCSSIASQSSLEELHNNLCHSGISRMLHFVRAKNLPFLTTDIKRVVNYCPICAEIKPHFHRGVNNTLIKATHPKERLSIDYKGPLASSLSNKYLFIVIDEYSRFPFAFPCKEMTSSVLINCLDKLFTLCDTPCLVHSDNGLAFVSSKFRRYLLNRGIASSKSSIYHPSGNGQVEKCVGIVWKGIKLCLKTLKLPISRWELVLDNALHAIRSLLCVATNVTPHQRFLSYQRRSSTGDSLSS